MKHFWKNLLSLGLMMALLLTGIPSAAAQTGDETAPLAQTSPADWEKLLARSAPTLPEAGTYAPNRLLVTRAESGMRAMALRHESIIASDTLFSLPMPEQAQELAQMNAEQPQAITCTAVSLAEGSDMLAVMTALSEQPGVLAVEVDRICTLDAAVEGALKGVPKVFAPARDPLVAQQTWLEFMGATKAWDMLTAQGKVPGEGVVVAVLDSGIAIDHPDLKEQTVLGGRRFWLNTTSGQIESSGDFKDGAGHGTHVSGMIAAAKNGSGITGVAYGAKILPIKILSDQGSGYESAIALGMLYAAGLVDENGVSTPDGEPRCDIANMSLGSNQGGPSAVYETAVAAMRKAGVFLVVAAGNEESATKHVHPANLYAPYTRLAYITGAFSVMAMQETPRENGDYLTFFSNWDSDPYAGAEYPIMAPGDNILSSICEKEGYYARYSGTSMASPATAGAAALVLSAHPDYTAEDLWSVLATSGQKRQGKTDQNGKKYDYHMLDVVAALSANPAGVKSVVKGTATGNWTEVPELDYFNDFALVLPTDGTKPQVKLTLRGYDGGAFNLSATGAGLAPTKDRVNYLAPGSQTQLVFTLKELPATDTFKTKITVTWINRDGSAGSTTVPVKLLLIKAAPGGDLLNPNFDHAFYQDRGIAFLWVFEDAVDITLKKPTKSAVGAAAGAELPSIELPWAIYYFGTNGSLNVKNSADFDSLAFLSAHMINPQISGDVHMMFVNVEATYKRALGSTIHINGGMVGCTIDGYDGLNLTVSELIDSTTIADSAGSSITAGTIHNSTLMNNFAFGPPKDEIGNQITKITVTKPTSADTGFYNNAVIGPAELRYKDGVKAPVPAIAKNCYYLPTANEEDNGYGAWVPAVSNKLECAEGSEVYVEGSTPGDRPDMLVDCPTFLISTKRVPNTEAVVRDRHLSYRLESQFSNGGAQTENPFGYCSYLVPDCNIAENVKWAEGGLSCAYTVYTNAGYQKEDDIYALTGLDFPLQYDVRNLIHDRKNEEIELNLTAEHIGANFVVSWDKPTGYENLEVGKLFCEILSDKNDVPLDPYTLTTEELAARSAETTYSPLPEGTQYKIWAVLQDKDKDPGYIAKGETLYYEPYLADGEDIELRADKVDVSGVLNLSGEETATLTLHANKSFNMKNGLNILVLANKDALEITSVEPGIETFSGIARDGDQTVIELAPAEILEGTNSRDQFVFAGDTIATLTVRGKNVAGEGEMFLHLQDFFGVNLLNANGDPFSFAISTKTSAVSYGNGDYTPPTKDSATQTLPDGTLVTTTTNPDGSIQIVYTRTDGVRSTVKTPAKGEASTASISLPPALAGTSVKVPIPLAAGGINTVAALVDADGKERVIPGSFWKDGMLTVPLTGSATILIRDNAKTFGDVPADHWGADAIAFVTSRELFQGDEKGFRPAGDTTRGMMVTVLARLDGQNTAAGARWDSVGKDWAKEQGISDGSGMEDATTREQLVVMLYRYAKAERVQGDLTAFSDAADLSPWAQDAMQWAVKNGIINGKDGALNPQGSATRAEVAAMLARFVAKA